MPAPVTVVQAVPPCPSVDYVWVPGYWAYYPTGRVWVPGAWCYRPAYSGMAITTPAAVGNNHWEPL